MESAATYYIKINGIQEIPPITAHLPRRIPNSDSKILSQIDAKTSLGRIKFKTVKIVPGSQAKFSPEWIPAIITTMPSSDPITFSKKIIMLSIKIVLCFNGGNTGYTSEQYADSAISSAA